MKPEFSIIYCYRNRDLDRVKRSLESLALQKLHNFETIFVDYGSDKNYSEAVKKLIKNYDFVKYVYNETRGLPWNRAHALNSGIRLATSDFIFTADIDLIFSKNFTEILHNTISEETAYFFSVYLINKNFDDWDNVHNYTNFVKTKNQGLGISLIPKSFLVKSGGYDEYFCFWGYEDNELYARLTRLNLKSHYYSDKTLAFHQWHPNYYDDEKLFPRGWRNFMKDYFESKKEIAQSIEFSENGIIYTLEDRKALTLLLNETSSFITCAGSLQFIRYVISKSFDKLASMEALCYCYRAENYKTYKTSRAVRLLDTINFFLTKLNWFPYTLQSKFSELNISVFQIRDMLVYWIFERKVQIEDFAIIISDEETVIKFVIVKK